MWLKTTNQLRTEFMIDKLDCRRKTEFSTMRCLKRMHVQKLWGADWVSEDLSRDLLSPAWFHNLVRVLQFAHTKHHISASDLPGHLGWHNIVDGKTIPAEPRDLIAQGRWNKVPVLITNARNESYGVFPGGETSRIAISMTFDRLIGDEKMVKEVMAEYEDTFSKQGIQLSHDNNMEQLHAMTTDKIWTCDSRSLARDIALSGGDVRLGLFAHAPKYDPVNIRTNAICEQGATCHSSDALYLMPQGRGQGIAGHEGMEEEAAFALRYSDYLLAFASGEETPWKQFTLDEEATTFISAEETRVVPGYRREQCDVLDRYMSKTLPENMQRIQRLALKKQQRSA
uniref:Carboxylesterase type B domain-containing protein n=1 Tax=Alexandrium andersonii TaxID=327968 RepID=A0A7S2N0P8_9DINO